MADQEPETESGLTKVARTVGSALGTVAAKASGVMKTSAGDAPAAKSESIAAKAKTGSTNQLQQKALDRKKSKRLKHRRQLGRKTKG